MTSKVFTEIQLIKAFVFINCFMEMRRKYMYLFNWGLSFIKIGLIMPHYHASTFKLSRKTLNRDFDIKLRKSASQRRPFHGPSGFNAVFVFL